MLEKNEEIIKKYGVSSEEKKTYIYKGHRYDKLEDAVNYAKILEARQEIENTSGQGKSAIVPAEIKKWNWGAFFLNWIWGLGNDTYIALLCFIPLVNIVMVFVLGSKGNEWAWQKRHWNSIEHFKSVQKKWSAWGFGIFFVGIAFILIAIAYSL